MFVDCSVEADIDPGLLLDDIIDLATSMPPPFTPHTDPRLARAAKTLAMLESVDALLPKAAEYRGVTALSSLRMLGRGE